MWKTLNFVSAPLFAEERLIEQQTERQIIQEALNKFKQPIPNNFVKLEVGLGNYMCSTSPEWKDKPLSERYGFFSENREWVQIDIPHEFMEILEITRSEDITYPLYLNPSALKKQFVRGAITIESEEELFIDKPISKKNSEKELIKRLEELEKLREEKKYLEKELETKIEIPQRDWLSFVDWLDANFVDQSKKKLAEEKAKVDSGFARCGSMCKDMIRGDKKKEYPLINKYGAAFGVVYQCLCLNAKGWENKPILGQDQGGFPLPYEENRKFKSLFVIERTQVFSEEFWNDFERLFLEWKLETLLKTPIYCDDEKYKYVEIADEEK